MKDNTHCLSRVGVPVCEAQAILAFQHAFDERKGGALEELGLGGLGLEDVRERVVARLRQAGWAEVGRSSKFLIWIAHLDRCVRQRGQVGFRRWLLVIQMGADP